MLTSQHAEEWESEEFTLDGFLDGSFRLVELVRDAAICRAVLKRERPQGKLSARERCVIQRLIAGSSQKAVSFDLGVALTTVSVHLRVALDKLGIRLWEHAVLAGAIIQSKGDQAVDSGSGVTPGPLSDEERLSIAKVELCREALGALTSAERDVALLVVDGLTNAQIGLQRKTSPRTVANQVAAVFRKLNVHGRLELIRRLALGASPAHAVEAGTLATREEDACGGHASVGVTSLPRMAVADVARVCAQRPSAVRVPKLEIPIASMDSRR